MPFLWWQIPFYPNDPPSEKRENKEEQTYRSRPIARKDPMWTPTELLFDVFLVAIGIGGFVGVWTLLDHFFGI